MTLLLVPKIPEPVSFFTSEYAINYFQLGGGQQCFVTSVRFVFSLDLEEPILEVIIDLQTELQYYAYTIIFEARQVSPHKWLSFQKPFQIQLLNYITTFKNIRKRISSPKSAFFNYKQSHIQFGSHFLISSVPTILKKLTRFLIKITILINISKCNMIKNLLVPGGLGFIGSHTIIEIFLKTKSNIIIVDDMSNCFDDVLKRIKLILAKESQSQQVDQRIQYFDINILDLEQLDGLFKKKGQEGRPIDGIMHFAAKKAIGESMHKPIMYFENNLVGSMNLFKMMQKYNCKNFIFSSTAGVYGDKDNCLETDQKHPLSPYGQSKLAVQMLLASLGKVHKDWRIISLRYFNPCGGHESGLLGDEPLQYPNNLFPYIQEVLIGKRQKLVVFGNDYPTPDGTCIRDYIHIYDLASAHVLAMEKLNELEISYEVYNLGSGCGYSVLEVLKGFEKALGVPVKQQIGTRRAGDVAKLIANSDKALQKLGWKTTKTLDQMCQDSCNFIFKRYNIDKPK